MDIFQRTAGFGRFDDADSFHGNRIIYFYILAVLDLHQALSLDPGRGQNLPERSDHCKAFGLTEDLLEVAFKSAVPGLTRLRRWGMVPAGSRTISPTGFLHWWGFGIRFHEQRYMHLR